MSQTNPLELDSPVTVLASNEVQKVDLTGVTAGKTWTLTLDGETTAAIAAKASATAAEVKSKLEGLSNVGSGQTYTIESVTGSTGGPFTITFGEDEAVPALTAAAAEGAAPAVTTVTEGGDNPLAVQMGTGLADARNETNPLLGKDPVTYRDEHGTDFGDA